MSEQQRIFTPFWRTIRVKRERGCPYNCPALTSKNNYQIKTSLFSGICEIIKVVTKLFLRKPERREVFPAKTKEKITRKETREHLAQFNLACELVKVIRHFSQILFLC